MIHEIERTAQTTEQAPAAEAAWTTQEIAARKALWTAVAARLAATLPLDTPDERTAYLAAVEVEVGCTLGQLQQAISQAAGPAPACVRASGKLAVVLVSYGRFTGAGDVRGVRSADRGHTERQRAA